MRSVYLNFLLKNHWLIDYLVVCFLPSCMAEINVVHGLFWDLIQVLQPIAGDGKGISATCRRDAPGYGCFSSYLSPFLLCLMKNVKCCAGTEVGLSPSCTERGNEKSFPPCPFPNLEHRGLLVLTPSWWGRVCPCSSGWHLGSGTWTSCKPRAVCGLWPPALHRLISPGTQC